MLVANWSALPSFRSLRVNINRYDHWGTTMISYAVKAAFFGLSISGLVSCWVVLMILSRIVASYFITTTYAISITVLQVSFCMGMIYEMTPNAMPLQFCRAQAILLSLGSFMTTGVLIWFTLAVANTVFRRNFDKGAPKSTLEYRHASLIWIVCFPVVATSVLTAVVIKLDAVKPIGDGLNCDMNSPVWVRFLGYAGISIVAAFPAFIIASATAYRLVKTHLASSSQHGDEQQQVHSAARSGTAAPTTKVPHYNLARTRLSSTNGEASISVYGSNFAIPASPAGKGNLSMTSSPEVRFSHIPPVSPIFKAGRAFSIQSYSELHDDASFYGDRNRPISPASVKPYHRPAERRPVPNLTQSERDAFSEAGYDMTPRDRSSYPLDEEMVDKAMLEEDLQPTAPPVTRSLTPSRKDANTKGIQGPPMNVMPAIWRLMFFQISFFGIEMLAALSTLIDVAGHRSPPMEIGTHHVALILAAWGPLIVFGHLPAVRQYISSCWFSWEKSK